jgi:hypothetical protein
MTVDEFEQHLTAVGYAVHTVTATDQCEYMIIEGVSISSGSHTGKTCDVGIQRSNANPWVPQAAVHVRPHLVTMGQAASQQSQIGADWQYLSRRFDKSPTPKAFLAHIFTVLGQL